MGLRDRYDRLKTGDQDPVIHRQRAEAEADRTSALAQRYLNGSWDVWRKDLARFWRGRCTTLDVAGKSATVSLDPLPVQHGQPPGRSTLTVHWGRATWTAAQVVGKRVRVGFLPALDYTWLDDTINLE